MRANESVTPEDIITFWFETTPSEFWWKKDEAFDSTIAERFSHIHQQATANELSPWRQSAIGSLAEIIILDQFSRNLYRDSACSFTADAQAVTLAQCAIEKDFDKQLAPQHRLFLYMPFMHSESKIIHENAVRLFTELGLEQNLDFELKHKAIIDRFGRYPHRNAILGRESTEEEKAFLAQPNSGF